MPLLVDGEEPITTTKKKLRKNKNLEAKSRSDEDAPDPHEVYHVAACAITWNIDLWCDVDKVIKMAHLIEQVNASRSSELNEEESAHDAHKEVLSTIDQESRDLYLRSYYKIIQIVPSLKVVIDDPNKASELTAITSKMNMTIRTTRSSDAIHLKPHITQYILFNPFKSQINPPIINANGRADMGLNHPVLARFLCPVDQLERFDTDIEQAMKDLKSGEISMEAKNFPALFWSGEQPGDDFKVDNMFNGLFRGYLLVRVGRHIFLGPSSALGKDSRGTRSCNAILHGMTTVNVEHIAYICVQTRFGISLMNQWHENDGVLSYFDQYHKIVSLIQNHVDTTWRDDLLKWWNKQMFGNKNSHSHSNSKNLKNEAEVSCSSTSVRQPMSIMEKMHAQMQSRVTNTQLSSSWPGLNSVPRSNGLASARASTSRSLEASTPTSTPRFTSSHPSTLVPPELSPTPPTVTPVPVNATTSGRTLSDSPLTDADLPLTPVTNKRARQSKTTAMKGNGKKRAGSPSNGAVEGTTGKRQRRGCK
ncbi:hypothetical protein J3R82DRAFT_4567 [Butyriboletus roseoflavus]|nr:hypothetical protein J3R82DRAFT_4567 [Butyriboletus roseoflavus]